MHLLPFLQLPAGDSLTNRASYNFCQSLCPGPLVGRALPGLYVLKDNQTFTFAALPLLAASAVSSYPVPKNGTRFLFTMNSSLLKNCQRWKAAQTFLFC